MKKELKKITVKSRKELHQWLKDNHQQKESIWLVTYKKTAPRFYIDYSTIVDEALKVPGRK
jgi:CRISPR/Cas system CSM-associated protein Csm4 (group 5 of RAMP superfamily)